MLLSLNLKEKEPAGIKKREVSRQERPQVRLSAETKFQNRWPQEGG